MYHSKTINFIARELAQRLIKMGFDAMYAFFTVLQLWKNKEAVAEFRACSWS